MMPQRPVVIVMIKEPMSGAVKTRLMPLLSGEEAARLAAAFAQDVVRNVQQIGAGVMIAYTPATGLGILEALLSPGLEWTPQQGRDLGERMENAMAAARTKGYGPVVVIGTDSPDLPLDTLIRAIAVLESGETDVVLGPTEDGGYYLVGTRQQTPGLFDKIAWSTARAFGQTAGNAERLGLGCLCLPCWYDIDTPEDLGCLQRSIDTDAILRGRIPATTEWFRSRSRVNRHRPRAHIDEPLLEGLGGDTDAKSQVEQAHEQ